MHCPLGQRIANELGTRELWAYYFFLTSSIVAIREFRLSWRTVLKRDLTALFPDLAEKTRRWVRKISNVELSQKDAFLRGTDIVQNYPILFGIKEGAFLAAETSRYIGLHERRASTRIALGDITHLEVPLARIEETRHIFSSAGIKYFPIVPIEYGEEYSRSFSLARLVSGDRLADASSSPTLR
jgi:hypothetical protein